MFAMISSNKQFNLHTYVDVQPPGAVARWASVFGFVSVSSANYRRSRTRISEWMTVWRAAAVFYGLASRPYSTAGRAVSDYVISRPRAGAEPTHRVLCSLPVNVSSTLTMSSRVKTKNTKESHALTVWWLYSVAVSVKEGRTADVKVVRERQPRLSATTWRDDLSVNDRASPCLVLIHACSFAENDYVIYVAK